MSTIPAMPTIKLCDKGMWWDTDVRAYKTCACQTCSIHIYVHTPCALPQNPGKKAQPLEHAGAKHPVQRPVVEQQKLGNHCIHHPCHGDDNGVGGGTPGHLDAGNHKGGDQGNKGEEVDPGVLDARGCEGGTCTLGSGFKVQTTCLWVC